MPTLPLLKPYRRLALGALCCLVALVVFDLSIPRLVQRIIDQGIRAHNQTVVMQTGLLMLGISLLSLAVAVGNNFLSVKVGEGLARDLRERRCFSKSSNSASATSTACRPAA